MRLSVTQPRRAPVSASARCGPTTILTFSARCRACACCRRGRSKIEDWPRGVDLAVLGPKPRLRSLWLALRRTAEASSAWFPSAPALVELTLCQGRPTDTAGLAALTALAEVRFADTKVSDLGFAAALPCLRLLELENADWWCRATRSGVLLRRRLG